ncbi:hypothetical protein BKA83DRAFT_4502813 [Pisolithus microcarpus]|nr:hypothetical protein BKA83DRAFT_4502813 [Pisolithus microcarpus]
MLFISSKDHLLALDLWPSSHVEMIMACAGLNALSSWEKFPKDLEEMFNWAAIAYASFATGESESEGQCSQDSLDALQEAGSLHAQPNWEWNEPLPILQVTANHKCAALHEIHLNQFDFVEVDTEFNLVVSHGGGRSPTLKTYLSFKHLVRLLDVSSTKVTSSSSQKRSLEDSDNAESTPVIKHLCAIT